VEERKKRWKDEEKKKKRAEREKQKAEDRMVQCGSFWMRAHLGY